MAARDLQECLLLQLQRQKNEGKDVDIAIMAIKKYFDEFTKKHYEKIQRGLNLDEDQLKEVMQQIIRLNPKPGGNVGGMNKAESYVVPDFLFSIIWETGTDTQFPQCSRTSYQRRIPGYAERI